jgi:hypothetical protein
MPIVGSYMEIENIYAQGDGGAGLLSVDVEMAPVSVQADTGITNLSWISVTGGYADGGIAEYRTRDANGVDTVHNIAGGNENNIAPAMYDDNVDSVTFWFGIGSGTDSSGGIYATLLARIFVWG